MLYMDGIMVFRKGEVEESRDSLLMTLPFEVVCKANFVAEYDESTIRILKNRWTIPDCNWQLIGEVIKMNESIVNKR